jgi:hypothetical protein
VQRARNHCIAQFLTNPEYTHLLFVDADITFDGTNIIEWVKSKREIIAGIYPKKGLDLDKLVNIGKMEGVDKNLIEQLTLEYVINFKDNEVKLEDGKFIKCLYAGTGMLCIKREVIEKMIKDYPETKYTNDILGYEVGNPKIKDNFYSLFDCQICPDSKRYLSEDFYFCKRALKSGFDIWADISMNLTHTGVYHYIGSFGNKLLFGHWLSLKEREAEEKKKE